MRPKKRILLVGDSELHLSTLHLMLDVWGFDVTVAASSADALESLLAESYELMLCDLPLFNAEYLLDQAWTINRLMHSLVLADKFSADVAKLNADATLMRSRDNSELRERLKLLTKRKRGPRPHKPIQAEPKFATADRRLA
jgi:DNA-binding response OmpR family regulator